MEQQDAFDFPDSQRVGQRAEPSRKLSVPKRGTSICSYCGMRMPSVFLTVTPPIDDTRWEIASAYHSPMCRWIITRGLRLQEERLP